MAGLPGSAQARDDVDDAPLLTDIRHEVRVTVDHGHARITTRIHTRNPGRADQSGLWWMTLPQDGVASGLRLRDRTGRRWLSADLLDGSTAKARYHGAGSTSPRAGASRAWLSWMGSGSVQLELSSVGPGARKTVEVSVIVPTTYEDGRDRLVLPSPDYDVPIELRIEPAHKGDPVFIDDVAVGPRAVTRSWKKDDLEVSMVPRSAAPIDARLAVVPLGDRSLVRQSIRLAPTLSTAPRRAAVVVVIDGSRSLTPEQRDTAKAAAEAYLRRFARPGMRARAEVIVFDRKVEARHGRLVSASTALADLSDLVDPSKRTPGNGSQVDEALQRANALLKGEDARRPRRILLLTDALTREGLDEKTLAAITQKSGAIVHIGQLGAGSLHLERFDDHDWAKAAATTGGVVWSVSVDPTTDTADEIDSVLEELVRPRRVDAMTVRPPLPGISLTSLQEGQALESMRLVDGLVPRMVVEGRMWNTPFERTIEPDAREGDRWAGLATGNDRLIRELSPEQTRALAIRGGVVSSETGLVVVEPGSSPPADPPWDSSGGTGWGTICDGCDAGLIGHGSGGPRVVFDHAGFLQDELDDALASCGTRSGQRARMVLQSTRDEIVEIDEVSLIRTDDAKIERCVTEALWTVELPSNFDESWKRWTVEV